jgi:hypothetical protein
LRNELVQKFFFPNQTLFSRASPFGATYEIVVPVYMTHLLSRAMCTSVTQRDY